MKCPYCKDSMFYNTKQDYHVCPKCFTEVWPGEITKERGEYDKNRKTILTSLAAQTTAINEKPILPPGDPVFKGGSKSGKKRKKKVKKERFTPMP